MSVYGKRQVNGLVRTQRQASIKTYDSTWLDGNLDNGWGRRSCQTGFSEIWLMNKVFFFFFLWKIGGIFTVLKVAFHVQLLQNIGYIPSVAQYILEPVLYPIAWVSPAPPLYRHPLLVTTSLFSTSVSLLFCSITSVFHVLHFTHKWDCMIFVFDSLHLVWSSLGPSMLLQMAKTHSFMAE